MKKHNEGYTLVLVMIVLVILCILSTYILSFSLKNINTQKAAALRTQEQYAVMGEIEATVASLQTFAEQCPEGVTVTVTPKPNDPDDPDDDKFVLTVTEDDTQYEFLGTATCTKDIEITLAAQSDSYRITCRLRFAGSVEKVIQKPNTYTLGALSGVEYIDYDISMVTKGGGDDAQVEE